MDSLTSLNRLASELRLSREWLRREALAGRIPCLRVGRRMLFNLTAVRTALAERASTAREATP
jgi:excisionase family DNA binding protein